MVVDLWEDGNRMPVLGILVQADRGLLWDWYRYEDREYADTVAEHIAEAVRGVEQMGTKVFSVITDNCASMLSAVRKVADDLRVVPGRCLAHVTNLLIGDIVDRHSVGT